MNKCCIQILQELQNKLATMSETLLNMSGEQITVMEIAAARRAEVIIDIMAVIKEFSRSKAT